MYQLRTSCPGSSFSTPGRRKFRRVEDGGTDITTALRNGLWGIAASPVAAIAPQS